MEAVPEHRQRPRACRTGSAFKCDGAHLQGDFLVAPTKARRPEIRSELVEEWQQFLGVCQFEDALHTPRPAHES